MSNRSPHAALSVECFNETWQLLVKRDRSPAENRLMREMAHASLFHWLRREDCTDLNLSVGLWQVSRVHAVLGDGGFAEKYARECIELSEASALPPFYRAYAQEAAARAARVAGNEASCSSHLEVALGLAQTVSDTKARKLLEDDLRELERGRPR